LETMDFVDFLLCCIQNTQNCVAKALVPVLNGPEESKYAQIEREALVIIFAVRKFHQYLYGREFTLITDHRPLSKIFGHDQGDPTLAAGRIQQWASSYMYRIEYTPGTKNECADCLSQLPQPSTKQQPEEIHL